MKRSGAIGVLSVLLLPALIVRAADDLGPIDPAAACRPLECKAWSSVENDRFVSAREQATTILKRNQNSFIAHLVMAHVYHYGEASFPKALLHADKALAAFENAHGALPGEGAPWLWHARVLRELAAIHADLENYQKRLWSIARFNELYHPKMIAERAWSLMKLKRYSAAREAAKEGLESDKVRQISVALNALCATEFEAGEEEASYEMCLRAVEHSKVLSGRASAVDLTNLAEAQRSLFLLSEAERTLLEAAEADPSWYGNPWMDLADLYGRAGRLAEAFDALRRVPVYRAQRPPHARDSDRNESRRAVASFLLLAGEPEAAEQVTREAMLLPDRRGHNSRHPAQDRAIIAMLDRMAKRALAEKVLEDHAAAPWYRRAWARVEAWWLRFQAWISGRQAAKYLSEAEHLVGIFQIGAAASAVASPWMLGDLVEILGAGAVRSALTEVRALDTRQKAVPYYGAFGAEAALESGAWEEAVELGQRAANGISPGDATLSARASAVAAEALRRADEENIGAYYERVLQADPGVFRRLGWPIPVVAAGGGSEIAEAIAVALLRSPRFEKGDGLVSTVDATPSSARICLKGGAGSVIACADTQRKAEDAERDFVQRAIDDFHRAVFSPRVNLSQVDITSLDGSGGVARKPWRDLLGESSP